MRVTKGRIEFNEFSITVREVLVAIAIIALFFTVGIKIADAIERNGLRQSEKYLTAAQARDEQTYQWLVKTNIGNMIAEGVAECTDPVSMEGVDGEYWYIRRDYQKYTQHTKQVAHTYTDSEGNSHTYYTTEIYYSWDTYETIDKEAKHFKFLGVDYNTGDFGIDGGWSKEIKVDNFASHKRYVYYGCATKRKGTLFTNIMDNKYSDSHFYSDISIDTFLDEHKNMRRPR